MRPPYERSDKIISLVAEISEKLGEINAIHLSKPPTELRKKNRIKTIQSTLEIEGNNLSQKHVTAIFENKRVIAPEKDILEVQNAIKVYDELKVLKPESIEDLKRAHKVLMNGLVDNPGKLRTKNVGIVKGSAVKHIAPQGALVNGLINDLFEYLKIDNEITLIKSCVFHYELEFIHPFIDGNGRMGRLWQTLLLMQKYPVFEFLPIESLIKANQNDYYRVLELSDNLGQSTPFVEWMLKLILQALNELILQQNFTLKTESRIDIFREKIGNNEFSRKSYLQSFKEISQATASRDLKWAVDKGVLSRSGEKRFTLYRFKN